ncbi:LysM peptidoglycan-binding domain-containing protein [Microbacterium saperdae]
MSNDQNTKQTATVPQPPAPEAQTDVPEQTEAPAGSHTAAKGETLDDIAEKTGVPAAYLQRLNAIKRPDLIWPGMTLCTK